MISLILITISLGCVSATEIDDTNSTIAISDDSQIKEINNEITETNIEKTTDESISFDNTDEEKLTASNYEVLSSDSKMEVRDKATGQTTVNVNKGTTVTIQASMPYDSYYLQLSTDSSFATKEYLTSDTGHVDWYDMATYTFNDEGTFYFRTYNAYGRYDDYSNVLTYNVGSGSTPVTNETTDNNTENNNTSDDYSVTISLYDMAYPSNTTISHVGDHVADLAYNLVKTGTGFSDENIDVYCNDEKIGTVSVREDGRLGNITITEDDSYEFYIVYQATVNGKDIEAKSNTLTYVVSNTSGGQKTNGTGNKTEDNSSSDDYSVTISLYDMAYPSNTTISHVGDHVADLAYNLVKTGTGFSDENIDVYCNDEKIGTVSVREDGRLGNITITEDDSYEFYIVYQATVNGKDIEAKSNILTYVVSNTTGGQKTNETDNNQTGNNTGDNNQTGNNTGDNNSTGNNTGDNNSTGNNTEDNNSTDSIISIRDSAYPNQSVITLTNEYEAVIEYLVNVPSGDLLTNDVVISVNGEGFETVSNPASGVYTPISKKITFNETGDYVVSVQYKYYVFMGAGGDVAGNTITYKVTITNSTENNTDDNNSTGDNNQTGNNTGDNNSTGDNNQTGNNTGDNNSTGNETANNTDVSVSIRDSSYPNQSVITLTDEYEAVIEYLVNVPSGDLISNDVVISVNGEGFETVSNPVSGVYTLISKKIVFNETGDYVVSVLYKYYVFSGNGGDVAGNTITYKVTLSNSNENNTSDNNQTGNNTGGNNNTGDNNSTDDNNTTGDNNSTGSNNNTGNVTDGNNTGNNNSTGNITNPTEAKITPEISSDAKADNNKAIITVNVPKDATGSVNIDVAGKNYQAKINNGIATVEIPNLDAGDYNYAVIYPGDDKYLVGSTSGKFTIANTTKPENTTNSKTTPEISSDAKVDGNKATVTVKVPSDATGNVTVYIDGKEAANVPVVNGSAVIPIDNLTDGAHLVQVKYNGDDKYDSTSQYSAIAVEKVVPATKKDTILIADATLTRVANDHSKTGENGTDYYVTLTDIDGHVLVNKTVQIAINGVHYYVQTDENGMAHQTVSMESANVYTYAFAFQGDDEYNAAPLTSTRLTVTKKATTITAAAKTFKKSAKTKKYTVKLGTVKNADGKTYLASGKKITLKVNGKTYTGKTNAKNQVTFNLKLTKKGTFKAVIKFAGSKIYAASSKKVNISIK